MRAVRAVWTDAALIHAVEKIHLLELREQGGESLWRQLRGPMADHRHIGLAIISDRSIEEDSDRIYRADIRRTAAPSHLDQGVWRAGQLLGSLTSCGGSVVRTSEGRAREQRRQHGRHC